MQVVIVSPCSKAYKQTGVVVGSCMRKTALCLIIKLDTVLPDGCTHARVIPAGIETAAKH